MTDEMDGTKLGQIKEQREARESRRVGAGESGKERKAGRQRERRGRIKRGEREGG